MKASTALTMLTMLLVSTIPHLASTEGGTRTHESGQVSTASNSNTRSEGPVNQWCSCTPGSSPAGTSPSWTSRP